MTTTLGRLAVILATGLMTAVLAGCTGSPKPQTTASPTVSDAYGLRYGDAPALLVQCGLITGAIKPQAGQPWYSDGKVLPLSGTGAGSRGAELSTWWDAHNGTVIAGKSLSDWQLWAAQHDALPAQVCGTRSRHPACRQRSTRDSRTRGRADPAHGFGHKRTAPGYGRPMLRAHLWTIGPVLCQCRVVSAPAAQVKVPHNPSPSTAPAHRGPAHTTNPTRRPDIAQVFYGCDTLPILSSRVSHSCAGQPFSVTSNGTDEEKVAHAGAFAAPRPPSTPPSHAAPGA